MNKVIYICLLVIVYLLFRTLSKTEFFDNKHFFKYEENKNKFKFIINHITKYTITKAGDLGPPFMKLMYFDGRKGSIFIPEFHKENEATIKLFFNPKPNNIMTLLHLPKIKLLLTVDNDVLIFKHKTDEIKFENKIKFYVLSFIGLSINYNNNKVKIHFNGFEKEFKIDKITFAETTKSIIYRSDL